VVAELRCFNASCGEHYDITEVLYNCPKCGGLLETTYNDSAGDPAALKKTFRERRMSNAPLDQSGVWRYRELLPFLDDYGHVVTLREGKTPLLESRPAAEYGALDRVTFKHQGFNPTRSFQDNGMTFGASQTGPLGI